MEHTDLTVRNKPIVNMDLNEESISTETKGYHAVIKKYSLVALTAATACVYAVSVMRVHENGASHRTQIRTLNKTERTTTKNSGFARVLDPPIRETVWPLPKSPYEELWPGYPLPIWALKSPNYEVPASDRMCFVHGTPHAITGNC
jgi:hypothetical protein